MILPALECYSQVHISGRVLNNRDKTPVANASVFLSNATVGTESGTDGTFTLKNAKPGKYDLIVSILGFEPYSEKITVNENDLALADVVLAPKVIALKEVKIKAGPDPDRDRNYQWFKEEFLGTSELAAQCTILNPGIINLDYDESTRTLTASASGFIEIENDALGYKIKYLLTDFTLNNQNSFAKKVHFEGSALFEKMQGTPTDERRWQKQRQHDYEGSPMHFLRSVVADPIQTTALPQFFKDGFWPMLLVTYPNPERPADSLIAAKISFFKKTRPEIPGSKDSLARWAKAAKLPKTLQKLFSEPLKKEDFLKPTDQKDVYALGLTRTSYSLFINYNKDHLRNFYHGQTTLVVRATDNLADPKNTENTQVNFNEPHAFFDRNGGVSNVNSITLQGVWGRRRMAELLPLDYVPASNDSPVADEIISKLNSFTGSHIPERAYLQFDKPYYAAGDTLYFKAYVTKGEDHRPSDISAVLHVDLIGTDNRVGQSLKLRLKGGVAWGEFALPDSLPAGNYRVRAYTRWMQNEGEDAFFSQNIPIGSNLNKISESGDTPGKLLNAKAEIQFLPEGGTLIARISSKIAFKAIGTNGLGIGLKGIILDNYNKQVCSFASSRLGMGYFYLNPDIDKTYKAKIIYADGTQNIVYLPKPYANGITLSVNNDSLSKASVRIMASNAYFLENRNKDFTLLVSSGGVNTKITCTLDSAAVKLDIFKKRLNTGIIRFTLFSPKGEALCERLAFIKNKDLLNLGVTSDRPLYNQREQVTINLNSSNGFGEPETGHFSVSVIDESKVTVDENAETTILTDLLLTSDLKGTVEQPNYYFTGIADEKLKELDLVMLTHGYRRFEWKRIFDASGQPVAYQPEKGLEISGAVTSLLGKPAPNATVSLIATQSKQLISTTADDKGNFRFETPLFSDSAKFILQALNDKGKNRTKLIYNGDNYPLVTAIPKRLGNELIPGSYLANSEMQREELRTLGLGKSRLLKEVKIKAVKKADLYETQSLAGAGHADQVMHAEEIEKIQGPLITSLEGRLHGVIFAAKTQFEKAPYLTGGLGDGPMLVVVDGSEEADINSLNASDVETVEVLKYAGASIYGMRGGNGVLVVTTKRGAGTNAKDIASVGILPINVIGCYKARQFYSPKYESAVTSIHPDLRTTIYWNPELTTDQEGKASFSYYNADGAGNYRLVIEGIDEKGNIGRQIYRYKVE